MKIWDCTSRKWELDEVNEIVEEAEMANKKVEMIISYTVDGNDFLYNDNHGRLIRCRDCIHYKTYGDLGECDGVALMGAKSDDYCSRAEVI